LSRLQFFLDTSLLIVRDFNKEQRHKRLYKYANILLAPVSDTSQVLEAGDTLTLMDAITGLKSSPWTGLWLFKFNVQSAKYSDRICQGGIITLNPHKNQYLVVITCL
jgi:hypothetical protein